MNDDKQMVFALQSYNKNLENEFIPSGFLLFPEEDKADYFLTIADQRNRTSKLCHYTKFGYVNVNEFVATKVDVQNSFFVRDIDNREIAMSGTPLEMGSE